MLRLSSVFLLALLMHKLPILDCALGIPPVALYRSADGGQVVCDLEDKDWRLHFLGQHPEDLRILSGDQLVVTTESVEGLWGWAATKHTPDEFSEAKSMQKESDGMGWVEVQNCRIELNQDARPICFPPELGRCILPFWNGFKADKPLSCSHVSAHLVKLADFYPADQTGTEEVGFSVERASQVEVLEARNGRGELLAQPVFCHLNRAFWNVTIPPDAQILIIEREFDAFHGLQRARVFLDDEMAGWWHAPFQDRRNRWAQDSCHIRLNNSQQGRTIRITIDPPSGVPLFSLGRIRVFAMCQ